MSVRQAAAKMFQRIRPTWRTASNAFTGTANTVPISISKAYSWRTDTTVPRLWILLPGPVAIILGINTDPVLAKDRTVGSGAEIETEGADSFGLKKIEDGSVVSNVHTSKWRIFTDNARELFLKGKLEEAEKFFLSAIQEAKKGFGERDGHVASAYNNLAELYRVKKEFDKAEPLYLEAINILEESFGPEDVRVGAALHNLGQFYLVQRKLEEACFHYERGLKIKGRVLGYGHPDYADTMYHLGTVLYLQGKQKDAEAFIQDSIRIIEEGGQGESFVCIKRIRYLSQIYLKSNRFDEAENLQRKILHTMELSKGWNSLETVIAAEGLALTLQSSGTLTEAEELLQRCLEARKSLLPDNHVQIAANILHIARVAMNNSSKIRKADLSRAMHELDKAKGHLHNSARIARQALDRFAKQRGNLKKGHAAGEFREEGRVALMILMQSLNSLGVLEMTKQEVLKSPERDYFVEAEKSLRKCISSYKEVEAMKLMSDAPELKAEYLSCLKHLSRLISEKETEQTTIEELKAEIDILEREISSSGKHRK